jgi:multidrug efflux system membrane fusion protein
MKRSSQRELGAVPNQFVNVRMLTQTLEDATLVPTAAIQRGSPGTFVYVVKEDSTVTVAPVKLGPQQGETTVGDERRASGRDGRSSTARQAARRRKVELTTREGQAVAPPKQSGPRSARRRQEAGRRRRRAAARAAEARKAPQ